MSFLLRPPDGKVDIGDITLFLPLSLHDLCETSRDIRGRRSSVSSESVSFSVSSPTHQVPVKDDESGDEESPDRVRTLQGSVIGTPFVLEGTKSRRKVGLFPESKKKVGVEGIRF